MNIFEVALIAILGLASNDAGAVGITTTVRHPSTVIAFKYANPCPSTLNRHGSCPGYIVDHILPLGCGGPDAISNMQWQTVAQSIAKDKWEIRGDAKHKPCSGLRN